jgi:hypothetical protein
MDKTSDKDTIRHRVRAEAAEKYQEFSASAFRSQLADVNDAVLEIIIYKLYDGMWSRHGENGPKEWKATSFATWMIQDLPDYAGADRRVYDTCKQLW